MASHYNKKISLWSRSLTHLVCVEQLVHLLFVGELPWDVVVVENFVKKSQDVSGLAITPGMLFILSYYITGW